MMDLSTLDGSTSGIALVLLLQSRSTMVVLTKLWEISIVFFRNTCKDILSLPSVSKI